MSVTIEEILEDLDRVFQVQSFDERKSRFNVVSYKVESLYQDMKVHLMPKEDSAFLNKVRNVVPSPDSLRCLEMVVSDFKHRKTAFLKTGVTTGRTRGTHKTFSAPPRSDVPNQIVYDGMLSHSTYEGRVESHHVPDTCSPSSDYGSSDCGGGGGSD